MRKESHSPGHVTSISAEAGEKLIYCVLCYYADLINQGTLHLFCINKGPYSVTNASARLFLVTYSVYGRFIHIIYMSELGVLGYHSVGTECD